MCDLSETAVLRAQDSVEEDSRTAARVVVVVAASVLEAVWTGQAGGLGFANPELAQL